ncbi:MAG: hypothetical protein WAN46_18230 [Gammaproteobacteria bacterium]
MAAFRQNQWQLSSGIGGSFAVESVATFEQNTHADANVNFTRRISAGDCFQPMSNANTFETNPGLNLPMLE